MKYTVCDYEAARELYLYVNNNYAVYQQLLQVFKCLNRKAMKGKYDSEKACKAFEYAVKDGAIRYTQEFATGPYYNIFNAATRREVCRTIEATERESIMKGDF